MSAAAATASYQKPACFAEAPDLVAQLRHRYGRGELPQLVAEADQEFESVGQRNRIDHGSSWREGLDRSPLRQKTGDASIPEVILKLGSLELFDRIARLPEKLRRLSRI